MGWCKDRPSDVPPAGVEYRLAASVVERRVQSGAEDTEKGVRPYRALAVCLAVALAAVATAIVAGLEYERPVLPLVWGVSIPSTIGLALLLWFNRAQRQRMLAEAQVRLTSEQEAYLLTDERWPGDGALALRRAENLVERADLDHRLLTQRLIRDIALFVVVAVPVGAVATFATLEPRARVLTVVGALIFEALAGVAFLGARGRMRELESDLRQLDYERTLLTKDADDASRAEKLFLKQQFEMKRYYDETLRQSSMLSYLGVLCIVGGFAVVGVTVYLVVKPPKPAGALAVDLETQQIVLAGLGIAASVLANVVATLFLRMHSRTLRALTSFHARHVTTHHVHFANLVASKVSGAERSRIYGEVAQALSRSAWDAAPTETGVAGDPS